jgi:hypothetical protein
MTVSQVNKVPENIAFAADQKQFIPQITDVYSKLAMSSNAKDIGTYELTEIINGQRFYGANPQTKRQAYRKCFAFGAIGAGATLNIAHGVAGITNITRLYATCITAAGDQRPIPFADITLITNQILIALNGANIAIVNGATAPAIVSGICVLEYLKQ